MGTPVETESDAQRTREEVNSPINELCLDNPHFGPLVLPGPSRPFSDGTCCVLMFVGLFVSLC